jgi:polar amino acid transport system permease protein
LSTRNSTEQGSIQLTAGSQVIAQPVRHWGRLAAAAAALAVVGAVIYIAATSQNLRWREVAHYFPSRPIISGVGVSLELTVIAMTIGVVLGSCLALMRLSASAILRSISIAYLWLFRGTPVLVQLILWFNIALFIPRIHIGGLNVNTNSLISPFTAAILALGLNVSAYMSEIVRSGIMSVDRGQKEAAYSIGMTSRQATMRVVLPQAVRVALPPTGNTTIDMLKTTALVSVIGTQDLLTRAEEISAANFYVIELLIVACMWYLILVTLGSYAQAWLERRMARGFAGSPRRDRTSRIPEARADAVA